MGQQQSFGSSITCVVQAEARLLSQWFQLKGEPCAHTHIISVTKTGRQTDEQEKKSVQKYLIPPSPSHHFSRKTDAFSWNLNKFKKTNQQNQKKIYK